MSLGEHVCFATDVKEIIGRVGQLLESSNWTYWEGNVGECHHFAF